MTCHEPLDMSTSPLAEQMKELHPRKIVAAGWTTQQIENYFVAQLGPQVLADTDARTASTCSPGCSRSAAIGFGAVGGRHRRLRPGRANRDDAERRGGAQPAGRRLAPALERRVDQELARFDT